MGESSPAWSIILMNVIKTVVFVFDIITLPLHLILQKPWKKTSHSNKQQMKLEDESDPYSSYVSVEDLSDQQKRCLETIHTLTDLFDRSVQKYPHHLCQGTRPIYQEEEEIHSNGKIFKKLVLGDYEWKTYKEVQERVQNFSEGLRSKLKLESHSRVLILADTCAEWLIAALACFRLNVAIVTLYSNISEDGMVYGINDTGVTIIISCREILPKLKNVLEKSPTVKDVVYIERINKSETCHPNNIAYHIFEEIESTGSQLTEFPPLQGPKSDDIAVIMYTSGSTGVPKAVSLLHKNIIHTVVCSSVINLNEKDTYIAYLPLAHILELQAEFMVIIQGARIGYSSPLTLTDVSTKLKKGCKGDVTLLKPTYMAAVPMILERLRKTIMEKITKRNAFVRDLFLFMIGYKSAYFRLGFDTPIINALLCGRIRALLGGNLKFMVVGGAPLSDEVHEFIRSCLNISIMQAYGLTETCSCNVRTEVLDRNTGNVGAILPEMKLRLVDWKEGNYSVTDKPHPRGEIIIGGDNVAPGYFHNDELTKECFYAENGIQWARTGDIGEILSNGTLKIIDRKKDIVKLQTGEYISLIKIETVLKDDPIVDNVCVVADSRYSFVVGLVVPNQSELNKLGDKLGKVNGNQNVLEKNILCSDEGVVKNVLDQLTEHCNRRNLNKFETPKKLILCDEAWTPDNGAVTSTFKLKRRAIRQMYDSKLNNAFNVS